MGKMQQGEQQNWFFSSISAINKKHEKLKHTIHNSFRYPLPPWGRFLMGCVYFSLPIIGGYQVMQWAISKSHASIGEKGEKLKIQHIQSLGDKRIIDGGKKEEKVGAGGWGGGVHLAVSDEETQKRNNEMLYKFLKKHAKKKKKEKQPKVLSNLEGNSNE